MGVIIIATIVGLVVSAAGFFAAKSAKPGEVNDRRVLLIITSILPILVVGFGVAALAA